jgi:hypothetical protein
MYTDVTLKADDFSKIHNALWQLQYGNEPNVEAQVEIIRAALKDCYEQDMAAGQRLMDHYNQVKKDLGLDAIWSITEVKNLSEPFTYTNVRTVTYKDHWGETEEGEDIGPVVVSINGNTWAALYVAANAAIRDSGDAHHIFIEGFKQVGNTLVLTTGS